jgi:predicted RNA binding protein YcfA (HicA-like mRNA interferase family)
MNDFGDAVRKALSDGGCWFHRQGRGDHEIWRSPHSGRPFTVDKVIKSRHTANGIMKEAGLPFRFR